MSVKTTRSRTDSGIQSYLDGHLTPFQSTADILITRSGGGGESILGSLISLASSLNSLSATNISYSTVQSTIESTNSSFNTFAVVSDSNVAESLGGQGTVDGKYTFPDNTPRFVYNTSNSNILSTGNDIVDMSGGSSNSLPEIDGLKWMAGAMFAGTTFRGILLWVFTNDLIDSSNVITTNGHPVVNAKDIFYDDNAASSYNRIYQVVIESTGIVGSDVSGNAGWNYSNNQQPSTAGYNATNRMAVDDGIWAFILGGKTDGNDPGPDYRSTNGYGFGNYNGGDGSTNFYWGGTSQGTNDHVGFIFTGDA